MNLSHARQTAVCNECLRRFATNRALLRHVRDDHSLSPEEYCARMWRTRPGHRWKLKCACGREKRLISMRLGFHRHCSVGCRYKNTARHKRAMASAAQWPNFTTIGRDKGDVHVVSTYGPSFKDVRAYGVLFKGLMGFQHLFLRDLREFGFSVDELTLDVPPVAWRQRRGDPPKRYWADFYVKTRNILVEILWDETHAEIRREVAAKALWARRAGFGFMLILYTMDERTRELSPKVEEWEPLELKGDLRYRLRQLAQGNP